VLVGQYELPEPGQNRLLDDEELRSAAAQAVDGESGSGAGNGIAAPADANVNPDLIEYGSGKATIEEYYITDESGTRTSAIIKGSDYSIHMRVRVNEDIPGPIFAYTIKNIRGTEITGTNTMIEKSFLEPVRAGEVKEITFTQHMNLQGGEYLLSLGCTGFEEDEFTVYHRLYDVLNITVVSDKNTVGYYDMESTCKVE
jgi:teichoic acid transport system ATP-binding protein